MTRRERLTVPPQDSVFSRRLGSPLSFPSLHQLLAACLLVLLLASADVLARECECGIEGTSTRIINGHPSVPGTFPWVVYILNRDLLMACSGVIVSDRVILTAAHCISPTQDPKGLYVFTDQGCERHNLFAGRQLRVKFAFRHPEYVSRTGGADIGILHLQRPLAFNASFMPICLSPGPLLRTDGATPCLVGEDCDEGSTSRLPSLIVSGWGQVNERPSDGGMEVLADSDCLNEAAVDPVPDWICRLHYGSGVDTQRILCAGGGSNICHGDSGGPLMLRHEGRVFLTGVTSFGRQDCGIQTRAPAAFERIHPHLEWIRRHSLFSHLCFK